MGPVVVITMRMRDTVSASYTITSIFKETSTMSLSRTNAIFVQPGVLKHVANMSLFSINSQAVVHLFVANKE